MKYPEGVELFESYVQRDNGVRSTKSADDCRTSPELRPCLDAIERGARLDSCRAIYNSEGRAVWFYLRFIEDGGGEVEMRIRPDKWFGCLAVSFMFIEEAEDRKYRVSSGDGAWYDVSTESLKRERSAFESGEDLR